MPCHKYLFSFHMVGDDMPEETPRVSVVIPAHNEEKWIAACLRSVLKDTYANKEIIVIDDASSDTTSAILRSFPVNVIQNRRPQGPSSARNTGVDAARGEIIVFVDAHCIVEDAHWIEKVVHLFRDPDVGAVAGYLKKKAGESGPSLTFKTTTQRRLIKSANAAYRKEVFEEVGGFDPSLEWAGDAALTYKVHRSGWKVVHARDVEVVHAAKLWSIKRAFSYGTCCFPMRRRYAQEKNKGIGQAVPVDGRFFLTTMGMGVLLTGALAADVMSRMPIFALSFTSILGVLQRGAREGSGFQNFRDGLYTTLWCYSYFFGALYGEICTILTGTTH